MDRREFMHAAGAAGMGMALPWSAWAGAPTNGQAGGTGAPVGAAFGRRPFAGELARGAVVADARRLALAALDIEKKPLRWLQDAQGALIAGVLSPVDGATLGRLLEPAKARPPAAESALAAGAVCFHAADRHLRPFDGPAEELQECLLYRDAAVVRGRFGRSGVSGLKQADAEALFRALLLRTHMRWHTFIVDLEDPSGWIERAIEALADVRASAAAIAAAMCRPEPAKQRRFAAEPPAFRAEDAIIAAARAQRPTHLERAVGEAPRSLYGQAVRDGYLSILALSDYARERISWNDLRAWLGAGD